MAFFARRLCRSACTSKLPLRFSRPARSICYVVPPSAEEATAMDMIKYAKSVRCEEPSYSEAVRILQQGLSIFSAVNETSSNMAFSRLRLCLATIHANMSNFEEAADCLKELLNSNAAPLLAKGAALEALTALNLQVHEDEVALKYAVEFRRLWEKNKSVSATSEHYRGIDVDALALRRLAEMPNPADILDANEPSLMDEEDISGATILALAQFYHIQGSLIVAKELYKKAIIKSEKDGECSEFILSTMSMAPEAVYFGAMAGLGQLLAIMGDFEEAEKYLTLSLKKIERMKGEKSPEVGIILSCIGNLYAQRGAVNGSSEILLTEGMYKKALDLMKAPPLHKEQQGGHLREIVALTRARLGAILLPAPYRQSEVQKLKDWVEANWKNSRPLPELVHLKMLLTGENKDVIMKESKLKFSVVDVRLQRVFFK